MNFIFYLYTLFAILSEVCAQYLFKKYHLSHSNNKEYKKYIVIGILLYALTGFFAFKLLNYEQLIVVNIIWHIFHFILLFFIGYFIFKEKLTIKKIIATIFGIICILIFLTDKDKDTHH